MPGCAVRRSVKFICLKVDRKQSTLRERETETETERDRQADRQADRDRHRDSHRERETHRERQADRERERERERVPIMYVNVTQEISTNSFTGVTVECTLYSLLSSVCDHPLLLLSLLTSTQKQNEKQNKNKNGT